MSAGGALWRVVAKGWTAPAPAPVWDRLLGADRGLLGPLMAPTARRSTWWPCGKGHEDCVRELVEDGPGMAAVCRDPDRRCGEVVVPENATFLHALHRNRLFVALREGLSLEGPGPGSAGSTLLLGARRFGEVDVRVYFAEKADRAALDSVAAVERRDVGGQPVLATAGAPDAPVSERARELGIDLRPLPTWATLVEGGRLSFDLDAFALHHRFEGLDPSTVLSGRKRLVLDPLRLRAWLDGGPVAFPPRMRLPFNLLVALAKRPSATVERSRLYPEVWLSEYQPRKHLEYGEDIRQHRAALKKLADFPISTKTGSETVGGYGLDLGPEEVAWWSDPPQAISQRKSR